MSDAGPGGGELPAAPAVAEEICGDRLSAVTAFAELLAAEGPTLGLIGPREVPRLWERHVLNCAVVGELIGPAASLLDVGSGGGLPGMVLACMLPEVECVLLEPMLRRSNWLESVRSRLDLSNVRVVRGRAEDVVGQHSAPVVTARAVAPLGQLVRWCLPLVSEGGVLLALKGETAAAEIERDEAELRCLGINQLELLGVGSPPLEVPTRVVRVTGTLRTGAPREQVAGGRRGRRGRRAPGRSR